MTTAIAPAGIAHRPTLYIAHTWRPTPEPTPVHDQMAARTYTPLDDQAVRNLAAQWLRDIAATVNGVNTGRAA